MPSVCRYEGKVVYISKVVITGMNFFVIVPWHWNYSKCIEESLSSMDHTFVSRYINVCDNYKPLFSKGSVYLGCRKENVFYHLFCTTTGQSKIVKLLQVGVEACYSLLNNCIKLAVFSIVIVSVSFIKRGHLHKMLQFSDSNGSFRKSSHAPIDESNVLWKNILNLNIFYW